MYSQKIVLFNTECSKKIRRLYTNINYKNGRFFWNTQYKM